MNSWLSKFEKYLLGDTDFANLDQRFVHIVCLGGSLMAIISIPLNYFVVTGTILTLTNVAEIVILIASYFYSRITGKYKEITWFVMTSLVMFLSVQWFYNGGSSGGAQYYFMILALTGANIIRGRSRIVFSLFLIVTISLLVLMEYLHPEMVSGYKTVEDRYIDIAFSWFATIVLTVISVAVLSKHYDNLLFRVERKNRNLHEDLQIARTLQEEVFGIYDAPIKNYDLSILYQPSIAVGGDFFAFKETPERLRILVADINGHGVNAAMSAMLVKSEWDHLQHDGMTPGETLTLFNTKLISSYNNSIMLSAFIIDISDKFIEYASGGCPPQYLVDNGNLVSMNSTGPYLGLTTEESYGSYKLSLNENARVVLYSDSLIEEYNQRGGIIKSVWLQEHLVKPFLNSEELLQSVVGKFKALTGKSPGSTTDDMTIIVCGPMQEEDTSGQNN